MKNSWKPSIVIGITLLFNACSSLPNTNSQLKASLDKEYQHIVDANIIKAAHDKQLATFGGADKGKAGNKRLTVIVKKLVAASNIGGKTIIPILLNSPIVNAYSLGSHSNIAYVYVTTGLLKFVKNDAQLASVIAHEIAHIYLSHHIQRQENSAHKFNQKQELQADKYSVKWLKAAGYNQYEAVYLLKSLNVFQSQYALENQADYPSNDDRIKQLLELIKTS